METCRPRLQRYISGKRGKSTPLSALPGKTSPDPDNECGRRSKASSYAAQAAVQLPFLPALLRAEGDAIDRL